MCGSGSSFGIRFLNTDSDPQHCNTFSVNWIIITVNDNT